MDRTRSRPRCRFCKGLGSLPDCRSGAQSTFHSDRLSEPGIHPSVSRTPKALSLPRRPDEEDRRRIRRQRLQLRRVGRSTRRKSTRQNVSYGRGGKVALRRDGTTLNRVGMLWQGAYSTPWDWEWEIHSDMHLGFLRFLVAGPFCTFRRSCAVTANYS